MRKRRPRGGKGFAQMHTEAEDPGFHPWDPPSRSFPPHPPAPGRTDGSSCKVQLLVAFPRYEWSLHTLLEEPSNSCYLISKFLWIGTHMKQKANFCRRLRWLPRLFWMDGAWDLNPHASFRPINLGSSLSSVVCGSLQTRFPSQWKEPNRTTDGF